jgi:hypothetical protein
MMLSIALHDRRMRVESVGVRVSRSPTVIMALSREERERERERERRSDLARESSALKQLR